MLVSTGWLAGRLGDPAVRVVDMRWREDGSGRARYEAGHIPGAVYLDWSRDLVEPGAPVAFTVASPERLAAVLGAAGIGDDTLVVAYADAMGSGPFRLWWACRLYGHDDVRLLDGGLERWVAEGRPLTAEPPPPRPTRWTPRPGRDLLCGADDVAAAGSAPGAVVLDSRPPEQFRGEAVWFETGPVAAGADGVARTPRGELRAGRVPWALNVPVERLYREDGTMRDPGELRAILSELGVEPGQRVITYCGVGISSSALLFAVHRAGFPRAAMYDAGWEEWGRDPRRPVARG